MLFWEDLAFYSEGFTPCVSYVDLTKSEPLAISEAPLAISEVFNLSTQGTLSSRFYSCECVPVLPGGISLLPYTTDARCRDAPRIKFTILFSVSTFGTWLERYRPDRFGIRSNVTMALCRRRGPVASL